MRLKGEIEGGRQEPPSFLSCDTACDTDYVICDTDCDMASKTPLYGFPYARGYQYTPTPLAVAYTPFNRAI